MSWEQGVAAGMEKVAFERGLMKMAADLDGESLIWVDDGRAWLVDPEQGLLELEKTAFVRKAIGAIGRGATKLKGEARHLAMKAAPAVSEAAHAANQGMQLSPGHAVGGAISSLTHRASGALKGHKSKAVKHLGGAAEFIGAGAH